MQAGRDGIRRRRRRGDSRLDRGEGAVFVGAVADEVVGVVV